MAFLKAFAVMLIASFLLLHFANAHEVDSSSKPATSTPRATTPIDCVEACKFRCSKSKRQKMCKRACGSCCRTCNCVPPGTAGNAETCPCYFNLTTHNNRKKCP